MTLTNEELVWLAIERLQLKKAASTDVPSPDAWKTPFQKCNLFLFLPLFLIFSLPLAHFLFFYVLINHW